MKKQSLIAAVLCVLGLSSTTAFAGPVSFSVVGGVGYNLSKVSAGTLEVKGGLGYGGGLLADFGVGNNALELGAVYLTTKTSFTDTSGTLPNQDTTGSMLHIPVGFRVGGLWSFLIGGYYEKGLGSNSGSSDYGLEAGPRFSVPGGFFVDARFDYGLKSQDDPLNVGQTYHSTAVVGLVGYKFH